MTPLNIHIKGRGRPLVLLHGWGFDHRIWASLAAELQSHFTLYLVDLPGFGQTEWMDWQGFKDRLLATLPPQVAVSGWSMGGLYAMRLAIEAPERVSHLMVTASSPRFIRSADWPGVEKRVFDGFFDKLSQDPQQTLAEFITLQSRHAPPQAVSYQASVFALQQGLQVLNEWDLRDDLLQFSKPTCFAFGRLDAITPRLTLEAMVEKYPSFHYELFPKAAHMPFLSHQAAYLTMLLDFLR